MDIDKVTQVAYLSASVLSFILTCVFASQIKRGVIHWSFCAAACLQTIWLLMVGFSQTFNIGFEWLMVGEALHFTAWIWAVFMTTQYYCQTPAPKIYTLTLLSVCSSIIAIDLAYALYLFSWFPSHIAFVIQSLTLSILSLLALEQLYRNVTNLRVIKLLCLTLSAIFIYDVYFFSQKLVQPELGASFFQIRAAMIIVACVFMSVASITLTQHTPQPARLSLSRPVVFYTTSLTLAGTLLAGIALGGYYVRIYGGEWGEVAYSVLMVTAVLAISSVFASRKARKQLTVLIDKHLFSHKYDYRTEWLKLIEHLSHPTSPNDVNRQAVHAVAHIFKSKGGALWLRKGNILTPVFQEHLAIPIVETIEPIDSPFAQALQNSEWVFIPFSQNPKDTITLHNQLLPSWIKTIPEIWLILPLLADADLIGFMVLTHPQSATALNWEDLDLLKTVGRQVANFLQRHEQAEQLAEARQFDAFNKLSAFVMHDLKNLVAQQSLVVKNAEKHKDNPAFVDDAIQTINNSVTRMNNLLRKLQRNEPEGVKTLNINDILIDAIKRCQKQKPLPTLRNDILDLKVKGDQDSLTMVFVHLIQNAQDATAPTGFVDIAVNATEHSIDIDIEDNGDGMDAEFVRDRLFKPFETTKSGKGMGIGVFQARDYVQVLGGTLTVHSVKAEGTTFSVHLPKLKL